MPLKSKFIKKIHINSRLLPKDEIEIDNSGYQFQLPKDAIVFADFCEKIARSGRLLLKKIAMSLLASPSFVDMKFSYYFMV
jgi:hypothetical protein